MTPEAFTSVFHPARPVITMRDDPTAQTTGVFEHYNANPARWHGLLVCTTAAPAPVCACGRYTLDWTKE